LRCFDRPDLEGKVVEELIFRGGVRFLEIDFGDFGDFGDLGGRGRWIGAM